MKPLMILACLLLCGGQAVAGGYDFLRKVGVNYTTFPTEMTEEVLVITHQQAGELVDAVGPVFVAENRDTEILCVRPVDSNHTLVVYAQHNPDFSDDYYRVILITYDQDGKWCDAMLDRDWSSDWTVEVGPGQNAQRAYSSSLDFSSHTTFTRTNTFRQYDHGNYNAPQWLVRWHQSYEIDTDGHFHVTEVKEDERSGNVAAIDHEILVNMRLYSLLMTPILGDNTMEMWNAFIPEAEATYGGASKLLANGIVSAELGDLYLNNPQRFVQWMGTHRDGKNHLMPYFERCDCIIDGESVRQEVSRLTDSQARKHLEPIVADWE